MMLPLRLLWLLPLLFAGASWGHDLGLARILLHAEGTGSYRLEARLPEKLQASPPQLPARFRITDSSRRLPDRVTQVARWRFQCSDKTAMGQDSVLLSWKREGALVTVRDPSGAEQSRFLPSLNGDIRLDLDSAFAPAGSPLPVAKQYLSLGVEHILLGLDHLAFVLALCLIASGHRLVLLVTGFTLGHSLTLALALAVLGWVQLPIAPVEACIALSIAFVAREAFRPEAERRQGFWLVAGFGMLHGLGFASALSEAGIARDDLLLGLLSFNLGVEAGQLLFVAAVLLSAGLMRKLSVEVAGGGRGLAFGLGSLAMFWTFERVLAFGF